MEEIWCNKCIFSPSLITLDLCNIEQQVKLLEKSGIKMLHIDIIDGHFSPSMPLGLETVRQLRKKTNLAFDVHLMTTNNEYFIDELLNIGVQQLIFHAETEPHIDNMINKIKAKNVRAGIALKPASPLTQLDYILEKCDTILLMLINPGYAGHKSESQVPYAERKLKDLKKMISEQGLKTLIEIDGRVSVDNIRNFGKSMVDIFVTGSTCVSKTNIAKSIEKLYEIRDQILNK